MTYSSVLWVPGQFTRLWGTTTATTSAPFVVEAFKQLLTHYRAQDAPQSLGGALGQQFSWSAPPMHFLYGIIENILFRNYNHLSSLWGLEQWLPQSVVAQARTHYSAFSVQRTDGLRVISLNTDLCKCHDIPRNRMN